MEEWSTQDQYAGNGNRYALILVQFGAKSCIPCSSIREKIE